MGHLMRCLALARELNIRAGFLCQPNEVVQRLVRQAGFSFFPLPDEKELSNQVINLSPAALVVDSYRVTREELEPVKAEIPLLVVIDDLNDRYLPAHLLINGNVTAPKLGYVPDKRLLLGPEYVLLREDFRGFPPKKIVRRAKKLMVTLGGSDPRGLLPVILRNLSGLELHVRVVGPQFTGQEEWVEFKGAGTLELVTDPEMAELMRWADLALSAGGSTLYELCATGTPAVALAVAENQAPAARALGEKGHIKYLGFYREVRGEDLKQAVESLASDYLRRAEMSRRGQALVDGLGAKRCAAVIKEMIYCP